MLNIISSMFINKNIRKYISKISANMYRLPCISLFHQWLHYYFFVYKNTYEIGSNQIWEDAIFVFLELKSLSQTLYSERGLTKMFELVWNGKCCFCSCSIGWPGWSGIFLQRVWAESQKHQTFKKTDIPRRNLQHWSSPGGGLLSGSVPRSREHPEIPTDPYEHSK